MSPATDRAQPARLAFVGASEWMERYHIASACRLRDRGLLELHGIWNRTRAKARRLADEYGIGRVYERQEDIVADGAVDGIVVVVSREAAFDVLLRLSGSRAPILCEKPAGDTPGQADTLAELFEDSGLVGFNRRFAPIVERFRERIAACPEPPYLAECTFARRDRRDPRFVTESGVHAVDLLQWLLGAVDSVDASAIGDDTHLEDRAVGGSRAAMKSKAPGGAPPSRRALLRFASNAEAWVSFLPRAGYARERYTVHAPERTFELDYGGAYLDAESSSITIRRHVGFSEQEIERIGDEADDPLEGGGFIAEYRAFLEHIATGVPARSNFRTAAASVRLSHEIEQATPLSPPLQEDRGWAPGAGERCEERTSPPRQEGRL